MADMNRIQFWVAVSPEGEADVDRLAILKADCRLAAKEVRDGWTVVKAILSSEADFNMGACDNG